LITSKSEKKKTGDTRLDLALHELQKSMVNGSNDPSLLADVLELAREVANYRGQGRQWASTTLSQLFSYLTTQRVQDLWECKTIFNSFADARKAVPSAAASWDALEKLAGRAQACIQGPPSRSRHTSQLRMEAWRQLGKICKIVGDPANLALALEIAANPRRHPDEREAAIGFLPRFWVEDDPDEASSKLLRDLETNPPNRTFLITVLQAQIDLGLNDEFGALFAAENWDDANEEE